MLQRFEEGLQCRVVPILIPGVVSHCAYQVVRPELVAERIEKFASIVAWARLQFLVAGAKIATGKLRAD